MDSFYKLIQVPVLRLYYFIYAVCSAILLLDLEVYFEFGILLLL
jgi:hypothetical protein